MSLETLQKESVLAVSGGSRGGGGRGRPPPPPPNTINTAHRALAIVSPNSHSNIAVKARRAITRVHVDLRVDRSTRRSITRVHATPGSARLLSLDLDRLSLCARCESDGDLWTSKWFDFSHVRLPWQCLQTPATLAPFGSLALCQGDYSNRSTWFEQRSCAASERRWAA